MKLLQFVTTPCLLCVVTCTPFAVQAQTSVAIKIRLSAVDGDQWTKRIGEQVRQEIEKPLTKHLGKWYLSFEVKDPPASSSPQHFYAPLPTGQASPIPRRGVVEIRDIDLAPSVSIHSNPRLPGAYRASASKALGRYRIRSLEPKQADWGIENHSTLVWTWTGDVIDGKLSLEPKTESKLARNGPIQLVHGDWSIFVAIVLGVSPSQITLKKLDVAAVRSLEE